MRIPHDRLSPDTLDALIDEFVTRDGVNLADARDKSAAVRRQLESGHIAIVYDPDDQTCNIVSAKDLPPDQG